MLFLFLEMLYRYVLLKNVIRTKITVPLLALNTLSSSVKHCGSVRIMPMWGGTRGLTFAHLWSYFGENFQDNDDVITCSNWSIYSLNPGPVCSGAELQTLTARQSCLWLSRSHTVLEVLSSSTRWQAMLSAVLYACHKKSLLTGKTGGTLKSWGSDN